MKMKNTLNTTCHNNFMMIMAENRIMQAKSDQLTQIQNELCQNRSIIHGLIHI
jgi:hypothetical protein